MNSINLIPPQVLINYRRRRATMVWAVVSSVILVVCVVTVAAGHYHSKPTPSLDLTPQLALIQQQSTQAQAERMQVDRLLIATNRHARAARVVSGQPNWRQLLELITACLGDQVVLTGFQLGPTSDSSLAHRAGLSTQESSGVWIVLSGAALVHHDIPELVLRLETLGLFEQVALVETQAMSFESQERIGFRIRCRVR